MKRTIHGLEKAGSRRDNVLAGEYLVELIGAQYRWQQKKPFYELSFRVLRPAELAGVQTVGCLYCTVKALWKLSWFLTDFGYNTDLLDRDELDEKALTGLRGVVRVSYANSLNGQRLLNLDAFAPADRWSELAPQSDLPQSGREVA